MEDRKSIGVVIGRFQVPYLHHGHRLLLDYVQKRHDKVVVLLGVSSVIGSRRQPLDYASRKAMLASYLKFTECDIFPLTDNASDIIWSDRVDEFIALSFETARDTVVIYGGRDSFIPHYRGKFNTELVSLDSPFSGSGVREEASTQVWDSREFRAGQIYAAFKQYPTVYSCVDVAIMDDDEDLILLGRKKDESRFRFIGGFVDINDYNDFAAARREAFEETGATIEPLEYIASMQIQDWRYQKETDKKIMTRLIKARYVHGPVKAADDIEEVKWFDLESIREEQIVKEHWPLFLELITV
jgi:bifunctional NMN adenylyltransferase/nudix hydrolase